MMRVQKAEIRRINNWQKTGDGDKKCAIVEYYDLYKEKK
jgi:hypothetical protein